jgi:hypothetical protein
VRVLLALATVFALGACSNSDSDVAGSDVPTSSTASPPITGPGVSDTCPGFRGSTTQLTSTGPSAPSLLVEAEAGAQGCLDAVTFTFRTRGDGTPPGYVVAYRDRSEALVDGDPPTEIDVPGAAHLLVDLQPATSTDPTVEGNPATYKGNLALSYGEHHHLQMVRKLFDGTDTVRWVIGLDSVRPFRVDRAQFVNGISIVTVLIG